MSAIPTPLTTKPRMRETNVIYPAYYLMKLGGIVSMSLAATIIFILDSITSWSQAAVNGVTVFVAPIVTILGLWLKFRYDRWKFQQTQQTSIHKTDAVTTLERERLLDQRSNELFDDMTTFYQLRDKEKDSIIGLLRETQAAIRSDLESVINRQRELITQQADTIQHSKK